MNHVNKVMQERLRQLSQIRNSSSEADIKVDGGWQGGDRCPCGKGTRVAIGKPGKRHAEGPRLSEEILLGGTSFDPGRLLETARPLIQCARGESKA